MAVTKNNKSIASIQSQYISPSVNTAQSSSLVWNTIPNSIGVSSGGYYASPFENTEEFLHGPDFNTEELLSYLTEEEISNIIEKISLSNKNRVKNAVRWFVKNRHFSEEFLKKYIEYLYKNDILVKHMADINSREYSTICLYYETKDDDDACGEPLNSI